MAYGGYLDLHALLRSHAGGEPLLACAYGLPWDFNPSLVDRIFGELIDFGASASGGASVGGGGGVYDRGWGIGLTAHTLVMASVHRYVPTFSLSMELRCSWVVHHDVIGCELYAGHTPTRGSWLRLPGMPTDIAACFGPLDGFPNNLAIGHDLVARVQAARVRGSRMR